MSQATIGQRLGGSQSVVSYAVRGRLTFRALGRDLVGQRFGRLTVTALSDKRYRFKEPPRMWLCRCDCGTNRIVAGSSLTRGLTKSCGCLHVERTREAKTTHGDTPKTGVSKEYGAWRGAKCRCYNTRSKHYPRWGGRGIVMCDEWRTDFSRFLADMGRCPEPYMSLDRIDNDGPYAPANCRWATPLQQRHNQRRVLISR